MEPLHAIDRPDRRWGPDELTVLPGLHCAKPWRTYQEQAIYAASRINQLRKSSSAASQPHKISKTNMLRGYMSIALVSLIPLSHL